MKPRDPSHLLDMLAAARRVRQFIQGFDYQRFTSDDLVESAVCRQLQIIGDAARRLSEEARAANPQIRWRVIGMRNIIVHAYDQVDERELWRVVTLEVPRLIEDLENLVPSSH